MDLGSFIGLGRNTMIFSPIRQVVSETVILQGMRFVILLTLTIML